MVITTKLNSTSLKQAANEVRDYGNDLQIKVYNVLRKLAEKGIAVAEQTVGSLGKYITFSRRSETDGMVIIAQETSVILAQWTLKNGEPREEEVSPLLMAEFGAGPHAIIWHGQDNDTNVMPSGRKVGRGEFPHQTHAFESSWYYMDKSGNWQVSTGIKPTRPLHNAVMELISTVDATVREVFGNGSN